MASSQTPSSSDGNHSRSRDTKSRSHFDATTATLRWDSGDTGTFEFAGMSSVPDHKSQKVTISSEGGIGSIGHTQFSFGLDGFVSTPTFEASLSGE
ncbi:uncharacterized protein I303_102530 [Kwoniella dejecticola CBS 10117]|uniref:Uncharacterized protein n=1 Tax=Kwoniella dejecticola CBS 10117 TaxID=1296121 RepID=A0A1A6A904_9TREE|nr:uncharacterized protein I303_02544 [Kwoniella dejecticola CBS 10117]OBR86536.1 hypothetical protein I303_02544 [Kwoniella dejecticola CBS 10117]